MRGRTNNLVLNYILRRGVIKEKVIKIPSELDFPNTARCWACGKEKYVNAFGFCEECWITFAYLRGGEKVT